MLDDATSTGSDTDIDAYLSGRKTFGADAIGSSPPQKESAGTQQSGKEFDKMLASMPKMPEPPKLHDIPSPQAQQFHSPYQDFSGPAMFLAALGSLMTRHPMKTAMDSFTAMVNADVQGQKEVMANARENLKVATDTAIKQNEVEIERYKLVMDKYKEDANAAAAHMMAQASGFNDPMMAAMVKTGNLANVWSYIQDRETKGRQLAEFQLKQSEQDERVRHDKAMEQSGGRSPQAIALRQYMDENPNATAEQIQSFLQRGRGGGRSGLSVYVNKFIQEHPEATADEIKNAMQTYQTETTARNRFLSGPQGNTIRSLNVVVSHLQTMDDLSQALQNNDLVLFNRIAQRFAEETGQQAPTNFDTAKQIVGAEIIKALGVAGAGTQTERTEAADAFNRARSPEQIKGAIEVAKRLLQGQLGGLRRQFTSSTGLPTGKFDEMLEPETREYFQGGGDQAGAQPVRVQTPADAQKLAPGTHYITPDGKEYTR